MRIWLTLWCLCLCPVLEAAPDTSNTNRCDSWPLWQRYKALYVSRDGRVVDTSTPARITTSEGQSYGLMFALAADDRLAFEALLTWTENNLAAGDLRARLPAWQWGEDAQGRWRVLDANAASDADLWIAYALSEAGRLWHVPRYQQLARELSQRLLREVTVQVTGLGLALLPGPRGFVNEGSFRFNASYLPLPVLRLLAREHDPRWSEVIDSSLRIIVASAPRGLAADWIAYRVDGGFMVDESSDGVGSYDAIRVYLWAGMTDGRDPAAASLLWHLAPIIKTLQRTSMPPERIRTQDGSTSGTGPSGFSAALLPLLKMRGESSLLASQRQRSDMALSEMPAYFSDSLVLWGRGWLDGWLRFAANGRLQPRWSTPCNAR